MRNSCKPRGGRSRLPTGAVAVVAVGMAVGGAVIAGADEPAGQRTAVEARFLGLPAPVTAGMVKAGEGYFRNDARQICYQAVPNDYPFYQIFVQAFDPALVAADATPAGAASIAGRPAEPLRVSPGRGRTTCAWFSPDGGRLLFASSHLDPDISGTEDAARRQAEEDARTGRRRRYQWDFDPHMDLFVADLAGGGDLVRLTDRPGYDAECSFSPDGREILFVSDRDGDPDIYVMAADGSGVRQLTNEPGYDGGPFFSPDGAWITYRTDRLEKDLLQIHVMRADGSGDVAITAGQGVRWAPYWHPTRPWLIWTGADHSDPSQRPNYDLWIVRYDTSGGDLRWTAPLRLTDHPSADVLPVFSPDGALVMWTSGRGDEPGGRGGSSQLWAARLDVDALARVLDGLPLTREPVAETAAAR
jgi:TolB protein